MLRKINLTTLTIRVRENQSKPVLVHSIKLIDRLLDDNIVSVEIE